MRELFLDLSSPLRLLIILLVLINSHIANEWLRRLDSDADFIHIFSFDFSKAFDSVPHDIVCPKLRNLEINPYIHNWIVNFLKGRQQRVVVDGISTSYLSINRGIPQGTVIGPILFSIMINDIKAVNPSSNLLVKYICRRHLLKYTSWR